MHLHLNPLGGLAGDMLCAALLHARPDLFAPAQAALAGMHMPVPVALALTEAPGPVHGRQLLVTPLGSAPGHGHTPFREIRTLLLAADLPAGACRLALAIFRLLAEAEGQVHGVDPEAVAFHELGAWDSIADIVVAAFLLDALEVRSASSAPVPLGGGRVSSAHGLLPVPAPATALLLQGLPVHDDGIPGERVTPTGAAILRALDPIPGGIPPGTLAVSGLGFGSRTLPGIPNCVQAILLHTDAHTARSPATHEGFHPDADRVTVLRFEVDDQSPEEFALGLEALRRTDGVLSVTTQQALGKKGRPTFAVELLVRPESAFPAIETCFRETTTLGLRWQDSARWVLRRHRSAVATSGGTLEVKLAERPGGMSAKAEADPLATVRGHAARSSLRRIAEETALRREVDLD